MVRILHIIDLAHTDSSQAILLGWDHSFTFALLPSRHPLPLCYLPSEKRNLEYAHQ